MANGAGEHYHTALPAPDRVTGGPQCGRPRLSHDLDGVKGSRMDSRRFDQFTRIVGATSSRRAVSRLVGSLALGGSTILLSANASEAAKSGNCNPTCPACQACAKGKCKKKHGKKKCKPGTCVAITNGTGCDSNPCKLCQNGACVNAADGSTCNGTGQCLNAVCNAKPTCLGTGADCTQQTAATCCSGVCRGDDHCQNSQDGQPCLQTSDCITPSQCVGFVCQAA